MPTCFIHCPCFTGSSALLHSARSATFEGMDLPSCHEWSCIRLANSRWFHNMLNEPWRLIYTFLKWLVSFGVGCLLAMKPQWEVSYSSSDGLCTDLKHLSPPVLKQVPICAHRHPFILVTCVSGLGYLVHKNVLAELLEDLRFRGEMWAECQIPLHFKWLAFCWVYLHVRCILWLSN